MNRKALAAMMCAGMVVSMGATIFAADDWTTDVEGTLAAAEERGDNTDIKLAYVSMNLANPWNAMVKKGFEAACEDLGVTYQTIDSEYDVDTQLNALESLVNDGYNGFTFTPIDTEATLDIVDAANEAGIVTACIAQTQDNVKLSYTLNEYDYGHAIGLQAGEWIAENLDGKAQVCIISQDNVESVIARGDGVEEGILEAAPDVEIVAEDIAKQIGLTNVECIQERAEEEKRQFDFVVSRAVMPLPDLVKLIKKNVHHKHKNAMPNGLIVLKGGNLDSEIHSFRHIAEVTELSSYFKTDWFTTKQLIYLPL